MATAQQGLFDTRSQAQLLRDKARERMQQTQAQIEGWGLSTPAERSAASLGGMIGSALGNRFSPPTLDPDEQRRVTAIEAAAARAKQYRANNPNASIEDIGMENQKYLAEELIRAGDPQGIALATQYAEQARARRMANLEETRLDGAIKYNQEQLRQIRANYGKSTLSTIWMPGDQYGSPGQSAWIDEDYNAVIRDPVTGQQKQIPLGEYTIHPPAKTARDANLGELGVADIEARGYRQQLEATIKEIGDIKSMLSILDEAVDDTDGRIDFMAEAGRFQSFVTKWADSLSAIARATKSSLEIQGAPEGADLSTRKGAQMYLDNNPAARKILNDVVPPSIRNNAELSARWQAQATQLAYTLARAEEPGTRSITDNDFNNHLSTFGAALSDPEAVRRILLQRLARDTASFERQQLLWEPDIWNKIIHPNAMNNYYKEKKSVQDLLSQSFGTAANPGPGLTGDDIVEALLATP